MTIDIDNSENKYPTKYGDSDVAILLDWITSHKLYTIVLIILVSLGFSRIVKAWHPKNIINGGRW